MAIKVYIDQGHNPTNPNAGAEGNGYREQDLVFEIGMLTADILRVEGIDTRLSRPTSSTQLGTSISSSLRTRVDEANSWEADVFVSLHANAYDISNASGQEAFVYSLGTRAETLAENILTQLNYSTGLQNRGVFARTNLYVLRKTRMPATLVELGFITNPQDSELMAKSPGLFASGVANGILAYFGML